MSRLLLDLRHGESVEMDTGHGKVVVTLEEKTGQLARLRLDTDESIKIGPKKKSDTGSLTKPPSDRTRKSASFRNLGARVPTANSKE